MNATTLQIPMNQSVRNKANKIAEKQGFSSLQELIRVFLNQLVMKKVEVSFSPSPVILSEENDERYAGMINDVKLGKVKTKRFFDINELMTYLNK